jgi:peptidoglycan/xylan/chitin deacetylase (PgdA/CDA1 family)
MTVRVAITFDLDLQFLWIGTFRTTTLGPLSRGEYGARVGLPRVLDLLEREGLASTFFVPGRVAETYPALVHEVAAAGHEVALHGYGHERWADLGEEEEREVLRRGRSALAEVLGVAPVGFRSPAWDLNLWSPGLLESEGFRYDSSLMADDFRPYRLRTGDEVPPSGPLRFGRLSSVLEFPVAWELDDFPYFAHTGQRTGLADPAAVAKRWLDEFEAAMATPGAVFTLTLHPQVIGRAPRLRMLGDVVAAMRAAGARFGTLGSFLESAHALEET